MNKEDFVNHILFTSCERCPISIYCSLRSERYTTCEDVARSYYRKRMVKRMVKKDVNKGGAKISMV